MAGGQEGRGAVQLRGRGGSRRRGQEEGDQGGRWGPVSTYLLSHLKVEFQYSLGRCIEFAQGLLGYNWHWCFLVPLVPRNHWATINTGVFEYWKQYNIRIWFPHQCRERRSSSRGTSLRRGVTGLVRRMSEKVSSFHLLRCSQHFSAVIIFQPWFNTYWTILLNHLFTGWTWRTGDSQKAWQ